VKTRACSVVAAVALVSVAGVTLRAQEQSAQASASAQGAATAEPARNRTQGAAVPLKVTIVLSKYQNDKRVSSLPYELTVVTNNGPSRMRMGTQVAVPGMGASVPATPASPAAGAPPPPPQKIGPFTYRDVGTNIDCLARDLDNGRFGVTVTIEDSSLYEDSQRTGEGAKVQKVEGVSSVRTFRTTNQLVLRDGQSSEFTAATDKVTGEVIKAAVTLTVIK
jgi:hypothetical protein